MGRIVSSWGDSKKYLFIVEGDIFVSPTFCRVKVQAASCCTNKITKRIHTYNTWCYIYLVYYMITQDEERLNACQLIDAII